MRSFVRTLILVSVLAALLLPAVAYAAEPPFYTSTTGDPNGDGSGTNPRKVATAQELTAACLYFGPQVGTGAWETLYWVLIAGGNTVYFVYNLDELGTCTQEGTLHSGTPPGFGVSMTPPVVVAGLIFLGILLLSAAWLLGRRLRTAPRPS
ncbi:MAG: hypothetical protein JSV36_04365 [Anaerolineae bacterium]|jgi:hypothetical protein|nr:MAG: hypothetical protein JSV36_04365 [Anaerolineae bacterium]